MNSKYANQDKKHKQVRNFSLLNFNTNNTKQSFIINILK